MIDIRKRKKLEYLLPSVKCDEDTYRAFREKCNALEVSISDVLRSLVDNWVKE